jgi:hypothetical protein
LLKRLYLDLGAALGMAVVLCLPALGRITQAAPRTATIMGTVTDVNGYAIPNATVVLKEVEGNDPLTIVTTENGMRLSVDLGAISNAVRTGQITREQGEYVGGELYHVVMMRFQLFSALHAMLEADIARTPPVRTDPTPSSAGELVMVAMPFSSLQLSPALVEYLGLTPTQVRSIQRLMDRERPTTEPLMHELRTISGELGAAIQQSQNNENQGTPQRQRLAATQARLLKQLIRANSHLQRRINDVLDPQQRKKLDSFKRTSEVTVGEGN